MSDFKVIATQVSNGVVLFDEYFEAKNSTDAAIQAGAHAKTVILANQLPKPVELRVEVKMLRGGPLTAIPVLRTLIDEIVEIY